MRWQQCVRGDDDERVNDRKSEGTEEEAQRVLQDPLREAEALRQQQVAARAGAGEENERDI